MTGRNYERLTIEAFGRQLIESGDLDPVYIALHRAELEHGQLRRWLLAYWCLYHCGAASYLSECEGDDYWLALRDAAANVSCPLGPDSRWPRGHERRHWRGSAAMQSAVALGKTLGTPERFVLNIEETVKEVPAPYTHVQNQVESHIGFGPWIAFKVADMLDRLDILSVNFSEAGVFMFDDPKKAALMVWTHKAGLDIKAKPKDTPAAIHQVVEYLTKEFADLTAPPTHERPPGLQEVETVLCKWKSHMNGHYPLMNDTVEIGNGLAAWSGVSDTARTLLGLMPEVHREDKI